VARTMQLLTRAGGAAAIARRVAAEDSLLQAAEEALRPRFAVGDARYVDVLRLRTERLRARSDLAAALSAARVERQRLLALLAGVDSTMTEPVAPPTMALTTTVPNAMIDSLLEREATDTLPAPLPAAPDLDSL